VPWFDVEHERQRPSSGCHRSLCCSASGNVGHDVASALSALSASLTALTALSALSALSAFSTSALSASDATCPPAIVAAGVAATFGAAAQP